MLFPGYSPSKEIEAYARSTGRSPEAGTLTLISMGQGQEGPAEAVLSKYIREGGWVFLDNVHLMQARGPPRGWCHGRVKAAPGLVGSPACFQAPHLPSTCVQTHTKHTGLDPPPGAKAGGGGRGRPPRLPLLLQRRAHQRRASGARWAGERGLHSGTRAAPLSQAVQGLAARS